MELNSCLEKVREIHNEVFTNLCRDGYIPFFRLKDVVLEPLIKLGQIDENLRNLP